MRRRGKQLIRAVLWIAKDHPAIEVHDFDGLPTVRMTADLHGLTTRDVAEMAAFATRLAREFGPDYSARAEAAFRAGEWDRCDACGGDRWVPCDECNGDRPRSCDACDRGWVPCCECSAG